MHYLWVGLGGFFGAIARYAVGRLVLHAVALSPIGFPWATLMVNVAGSFFIGLLAIVLWNRGGGAEEIRLLVVVGFLGAFTTFSAFSLETLNLINHGATARAMINVAANVALCMLAVTSGYIVGRQLTVS